MFRLSSSIADDRVIISSGLAAENISYFKRDEEFLCRFKPCLFLVVCVSIKLEIGIANKSIV